MTMVVMVLIMVMMVIMVMVAGDEQKDQDSMVWVGQWDKGK